MSRQQPQMSRRDWFRLHASATRTTQQQKLGSERHAGLQAIEEPVNHGGVDLKALPPMHEATLDRSEVTALFADIEQYATAVHLIARTAAGNAPDRSDQLRSARDRLLKGSVQKLQIRYQWEAASWIDTLQHCPKGFHLVRIQHGKVQQST